jgi:Beta-galactosidase
MRLRLGVAALLGALSLTLAPASAPAAQPRDFYGVTPISDLSGEDIDRMGQGKVGVLRLTLRWRTIEPSPGQYDFSNLDALVGRAAANGIRVLPFPYGTPDWVEKDCTGLSESQCERVPPLATPNARAQWQQMLRMLVGRYGPGGAFWQENPGLPAVPITEWQIWNEPSSPTYWQPTPNAAQYAELVKLSHAAISEVDPNARVILAGLFATPQGDATGPNVMWKYLGRLYKQKGIEKAFDAIALHPYSPDLAGIEYQIEKALQRIKKAKDRKTEIMITEIGWGSDPSTPDKPLIKGPEGQAKLLQKSFKLLRSHRNKWNIGGVVWYAWQDPGFLLEGCSFCSSAGLFEEDGSAKPAWQRYVGFTGGTP